MGQILHGSATTTAAIRRAIHHSQEGSGANGVTWIGYAGEGAVGSGCLDLERRSDPGERQRRDVGLGSSE